MNETPILTDYIYFLQSDICRLCWNKYSSELLMDLFAPVLNTNCKTLAEEINKSLETNITLDHCINAPRKVCVFCRNEIEKFESFKHKCKENEQKLKILYETYKIKSEKNTKVECEELNLSNSLDFNRPDNNFDEKEHSKAKIIKQKETNIQQTFVRHCKIKDVLKKKRTLIICADNKNVRNNKIKLYENLTCLLCRKDFNLESELRAHLLGHGLDSTGSQYQCFGCNKKFETSKLRCKHEFKCIKMKDGYRCALCVTNFASRRSYLSHLRQHLVRRNLKKEVTIPCSEDGCRVMFSNQFELKKHLAKNHILNKKFVCESCGRMFLRQDYLYKHTLTHSGVKRYKCSFCEFRFTQRSALTTHLRKHTGERPYGCDLCPQRCISSSNLIAHRKRHFDNQKYECSMCTKKFVSKCSLREHIADIHERSQSLSCEMCGATYTRQRSLRRHLLSKHSGGETENLKATNNNGKTSIKCSGNDEESAAVLSQEECSGFEEKPSNDQTMNS